MINDLENLRAETAALAAHDKRARLVRSILWAWSAPDPVAGLSVAVGRFDP